MILDHKAVEFLIFFVSSNIDCVIASLIASFNVIRFAKIIFQTKSKSTASAKAIDFKIN